MQLTCPGCGAPLGAAEWPTGSKVRCPSCGTTFRPPAQGAYVPATSNGAPADALARQPIVTGAAEGKIVFVREEHREDFGAAMTFRIHRAPSAGAARAFLKSTEVHRQLLHIVVETPEGNFGRDIQGMYEE